MPYSDVYNTAAYLGSEDPQATSIPAVTLIIEGKQSSNTCSLKAVVKIKFVARLCYGSTVD